MRFPPRCRRLSPQTDEYHSATFFFQIPIEETGGNIPSDVRQQLWYVKIGPWDPEELKQMVLPSINTLRVFQHPYCKVEKPPTRPTSQKANNYCRQTENVCLRQLPFYTAWPQYIGANIPLHLPSFKVILSGKLIRDFGW